MELIGYLLHFIHVYDYTSLVALIINMLYGCTRGQIRLLRVGPPTCVILKSMSAWAQRSFSWPLPQARRGLFDEWAQFQQFQQKDGATKNTGGFEGRICKHLVSSFVWIWENSRFPAFLTRDRFWAAQLWLKRTETQRQTATWSSWGLHTLRLYVLNFKALRWAAWIACFAKHQRKTDVEKWNLFHADLIIWIGRTAEPLFFSFLEEFGFARSCFGGVLQHVLHTCSF